VHLNVNNDTNIVNFVTLFVLQNYNIYEESSKNFINHVNKNYFRYFKNVSVFTFSITSCKLLIINCQHKEHKNLCSFDTNMTR